MSTKSFVLKIILMNTKAFIPNYTPQIQTTDFTCAPMCLLNILRMKGDPSYTEQELEEMCGVTEVGTDNSVLLKVAERIGLQVVEEKQDTTIADIERQIDSGAFVIVNYYLTSRGFGHFSVVVGYDDEALYFADSYVGHLRIEKEHFMPLWHDTEKTILRWFVALK